MPGTIVPIGDGGTPANDNAPRSWAPQVLVSGIWSGNALRFATEIEARNNASDLLMRWFVPTDSRAVPSDDPVNYRYVRGGLEAIEVAS